MPRTRASEKGSGTRPLAGTVIKVDDVTSSKEILVKKLEALGARVVSRLQRNLTHVVFVKEMDDSVGDGERLGRVMAYRSGQCAGLAVVSVGWVEACTREKARVDVAGYVLEGVGGRKRGVPPRLELGDGGGGGAGASRKRGRVGRKGSLAMTPRAMETLEVDTDRLDSSRRLRVGGGFRDSGDDEGMQEGKDGGGGGGCRKVKKSGKASKKPAGVEEERDTKGKASRKSGQAEKVEKPVKALKGGETATKASNTADKKPQPALRFSTRCLRQYPSRPVKLDKSLPEGPVEVKRILKQTVGGHAPIPDIQRVESPWGTPQTNSRLPVGVIGNLDLRTVSKAKVSDATASTRKLIREVPSPWSVVRVYDNIPLDRDVPPGSIHSTRRRSILGGTNGASAESLGGGLQAAQTPMSSQGVRMSRAQVQSLRMSIQRHESALHHGSQNMSPNPSPLVLSGCVKKHPVGLSGLGPSSQTPPTFGEEVVTQSQAGTMGDVAADGDVNDEYGTQVTSQVEDASHPDAKVAGIVSGEAGKQAGSHVDGQGSDSSGAAGGSAGGSAGGFLEHSNKASADETIYYTAQEATQGVSQQLTQPLMATNGSQLQSLQQLSVQQPHGLRLSQEMLTIPTPSQLSVRDEDGNAGDGQADPVDETLPDGPVGIPPAAVSSQETTHAISSQQTTQAPAVKSGAIAFTSVSQATLSSCKEATATLPGLIPWSSTSRKSLPITHLIIGDNRRTLKTMLAVLHGAYLLRPAYVTDSVAAGRWLDEEAYLADVVFQSGAGKARAHLSGATSAPNLLKGKKMAIYNGKRTTASSDTYQVVRRICQELGGTLFHISEADIVIIMNDEESSRPSGLKDSAIAVRREWLFQSACAYELQDTAEFEHVFGKIQV